MIHETASVPPKRRRRDKRVDAILDAAMTIVTKEGFDGLTVTRLADALDLTAGALYRYFTSKDDIVAALQARGLSAIRRRFVEQQAAWPLPKSPSLAALCRLLASGRFYLALGDEQPQLARWIGVSLAEGRQVEEKLAKQHIAPELGALLMSAAGMFEQAVEAGALERGHALARTVIFWSALQGVAASAKLARLAPDPSDGWYQPRQLGSELVHSLLRGWGADPKQLEQAARWLDRHHGARR